MSIGGGDTVVDRCARATAALLIAAALAGPAPARAIQQPDVDVQRYQFTMTLPDTGRRIDVLAHVVFTRVRETRELVLDLLAPMKVSSASTGCGTRVEPARFSHDGKQVRITLADRRMGDTSCVTVGYAGAPEDGLVITTDSAGRWRAFGDNWPNRARHWLASVDHPSDKALVEFIVEAPATRTIVSNGAMKQIDIFRAGTGMEGWRRTTWVTARPIPTYLMVIAAAPLTATRLGDTACGMVEMGWCIPQTVYTAPEQARYLPGNFAKAGAITEHFSRTIGLFPYEQLAHVQSSTRFGGMENAGAIFYADGLFRRPDGVGVGLIAHEIAHQWFGDAVTSREWSHLWLSEGFATYFAALFTEHAQGDSAFVEQIAGIRRQVIAAPVVAQRPVLDTAQADLMQLLNANSYQKGGLVLHMLRREVGDTAFFRGIRDYYTIGRHGTALTSDLELAMERASGRELTWFFDEWLKRPGFIEAEVSWRHDPATQVIRVRVTQGGRFGAYRFSLPVEVVAADGTRRTEIVQVPAQGSAEVALRERYPAVPGGVRIDPRGDLLAVFRAP